jgi:hypothetical protein
MLKRVSNLPPVFKARLKSKKRVSSFFEFSNNIFISFCVKNLSLALSISNNFLYFISIYQ